MEQKIEKIETEPTPEVQTPVKGTPLKEIALKYLNPIKKIFTPNESVDRTTTYTILAIWIVGVVYYWFNTKSTLLPSPVDLVKAAYNLIVGNRYDGTPPPVNIPKHYLHDDLLTSLMLVFKAMFYATVICYGLATTSTMKFFKPIAGFFSKSRFLTTVGLSVIFAQLTKDSNSEKVALLVFSITVFLLTSFLGILADIKDEEYDYAETMKMSKWRSYYEIIILGKLHLFVGAIRQNFAIAWIMLPLVESYCRSEGGIGTAIIDQNKYFHLDAVYAIQIIVLLIGIFLDYCFGQLKGIVRPDTLLTQTRK